MMKYYLYISDAKVDMLLAQIGDARIKTISKEGGFDFKVVSAKRKVEYQDNADRIARLQAVVLFIQKFGNLGTVEHPDEYIEDSMMMYTAPLRTLKECERIVYFTGIEGSTVIGMGGSMKHLIGAPPDREAGFGSSGFEIVGALQKELQSEELNRATSEPEEPPGLGGVHALYYSLLSNEIPPENLSFLAKRLLVEEKPNRKLILCTPLYVAKND